MSQIQRYCLVNYNLDAHIRLPDWSVPERAYPRWQTHSLVAKSGWVPVPQLHTHRLSGSKTWYGLGQSSNWRDSLMIVVPVIRVLTRADSSSELISAGEGVPVLADTFIGGEIWSSASTTTPYASIVQSQNMVRTGAIFKLTKQFIANRISDNSTY